MNRPHFATNAKRTPEGVLCGVLLSYFFKMYLEDAPSSHSPTYIIVFSSIIKTLTIFYLHDDNVFDYVSRSF